MRASYIGDFEEWKQGFNFSVPVTVRFSETDMFGHLNNTVNFTYFEHARIEYLKHLGLMENWLDSEEGAITVVADLQCDYLKQVFFDEKLDIHVKTARVGSTSLDIHYLAAGPDGEPAFTGRGTIVQVSRKTGKPLPWSDKALDALGAASSIVR
ncbi:acyl-CoA thioesterase [Bhargavaea ginsengi]|uniref:acyl-CoA thioesterase n=1 Tax=Bhargavaea ginsengi TaxID=426757 RepID=UPI00203B04EC|nr:thioesterase family protein [Bhargavaea ginsengi]MCM3086570.1 acyl-CoA thioesterase [Bhargavaea ginsengi]